MKSRKIVRFGADILTSVNHPPLPPVSLLICSRNRPQLLLETVQSVLRGDELPAEIVILDQSEQPNQALAERKAAPGCIIRYIPSSTVGLSRGRNLSLAAAQHDLFVIIDDDMLVDPDWFGRMVRAQIAAGPQAAVTGRVQPMMDTPGGFVPSITYQEQPAVYSGRIGRNVLAAGHMAMYRSLREAVGPFDERLGAGSRFPSSEDNDFGYRLLEAGFQIVFSPEVMIYHRSWRKKTEYNALRWAYGRGEGGFYGKHLHWKSPHLLWQMLMDLLHRLVRFPWRFIHRPDLAVADLYYCAGMLSGLIEWWITGQNRLPAASLIQKNKP